MYDLYKALFSEFVGTFLLIFIGFGAASLNINQGGSIIGTALAFGLTYLILIYTIGNFSGANFNPAISFGLAVAGRLGWCRMFLYILAQFAGALAGGALIAWILGIDFNSNGPIGDLALQFPWKIVTLELILTFFLVFTFLFVTRNPMVSIISGFIIGLTLTCCILVGGFFAPVALNPAYGLAASIFTGNWSTFWISLVGPLFGALLAVLIYKAFVIPWSCSEAVEKGCNPCGELPFCEEWKVCTDSFIHRGQINFEENQRELNAMPAEIAMCHTPCSMPVMEPVCEKVEPCAPIKKRNYRYRQL